MNAPSAEKDATPESDERWNEGVDWLLNHSASYDTAPLFYAYVDGIITREELRAEVTDDLDAEGFTRSISEVINERREALAALVERGQADA